MTLNIFPGSKKNRRSGRARRDRFHKMTWVFGNANAIMSGWLRLKVYAELVQQTPNRIHPISKFVILLHVYGKLMNWSLHDKQAN